MYVCMCDAYICMYMYVRVGWQRPDEHVYIYNLNSLKWPYPDANAVLTGRISVRGVRRQQQQLVCTIAGRARRLYRTARHTARRANGVTICPRFLCTTGINSMDSSLSVVSLASARSGSFPPHLHRNHAHKAAV